MEEFPASVLLADQMANTWRINLSKLSKDKYLDANDDILTRDKNGMLRVIRNSFRIRRSCLVINMLI